MKRALFIVSLLSLSHSATFASNTSYDSVAIPFGDGKFTSSLKLALGPTKILVESDLVRKPPNKPVSIKFRDAVLDTPEKVQAISEKLTPEVTHVQLYKCTVDSTFGEFLSRMSNLHLIDLSHSRIVGDLSKFLAIIPSKVVIISLRDMGLTAPPVLPVLHYIEHIDLRDNPIKELPEWFRGLNCPRFQGLYESPNRVKLARQQRYWF